MIYRALFENCWRANFVQMNVSCINFAIDDQFSKPVSHLLDGQNLLGLDGFNQRLGLEQHSLRHSVLPDRRGVQDQGRQGGVEGVDQFFQILGAGGLQLPVGLDDMFQ